VRKGLGVEEVEFKWFLLNSPHHYHHHYHHFYCHCCLLVFKSII
jgi:hypothetical protein